MGFFNQNSRGFSGRGNRGNRSRGRDDREMFQAVCANCGKDCQVPFKPNGRKPVLCSACFDQNGPSDSNRDNNRSWNPSRSSSSRGNRRDSRPQHNPQIDELNAKLDRIIELLTPKEDY